MSGTGEGNNRECVAGKTMLPIVFISPQTVLGSDNREYITYRWEDADYAYILKNNDFFKIIIKEGF